MERKFHGKGDHHLEGVTGKAFHRIRISFNAIYIIMLKDVPMLLLAVGKRMWLGTFYYDVEPFVPVDVCLM